MNTHPIEGRLRDALAAHAEGFCASPDAWQHVQAKSARLPRLRRGRPGTGWLARHHALAIPAAAAAVVVAIALGATALAHGFSSLGRAAAPSGAATSAPGPSPAGRGVSGRLARQMLAVYPARTSVISRTVAAGITTSFWIGTPSPLYWQPMIATGPQFCHATAFLLSGTGSCLPLPKLSPTRPAVILSADQPADIRHVTSGDPVLTGVAEPAVTSVTAVLPDGQQVLGAVGAGRGFSVRAWAVDCSVVQGTKLIFTGSAGRVLARLDATTPPDPAVLDVPQPKQGGIPVFSYHGNGIPGGTVVAYLVDGHAGFWVPAFSGGAFSPEAASGPPVVNGLAAGLSFDSGAKYTLVKAFGYAHADVARVVVRLPGGGQVTTATVSGWSGSGLRLWSVTIPASTWPAGAAEPTYIATAYDAAGNAIGHAQLGGAEIY